jgi:hypothetical protein
VASSKFSYGFYELFIFASGSKPQWNKVKSWFPEDLVRITIPDADQILIEQNILDGRFPI